MVVERIGERIEVFPRGHQSHASTETCPGHSTILTGARPARTGIIANDWEVPSLPRTEGGYHLHLTDGSGRTVRRWSGVQGSQLKASALKPGIYLLEIKAVKTGKRVVEKLTVQ